VIIIHMIRVEISQRSLNH